MEKQRLTNKEIRKAAKEKGLIEIKERCHGQLIFENKKGALYYSYDVDSHKGGFWKVADSPKNLRAKSTRLCTVDRALNWIGD